MAFTHRGLGNKRAHANERAKTRLAGEDEQAAASAQQAGDMARAWQHTSCVEAVAEELEEVGIRTLGARTRAMRSWTINRSAGRSYISHLVACVKGHLMFSVLAARVAS